MQSNYRNYISSQLDPNTVLAEQSEHCRYVFSRECIGSIWYEETGLQRKLSRLWARLCWCAMADLSYSPIAGHNALCWNSISASEPRAVIVHREYLQGLSTWRRGHIVQRSRALGEGANGLSDLECSSFFILVAEYLKNCSGAYCCHTILAALGL